MVSSLERPRRTSAAVVIGSGAFGSSTAYHLTRRGLKVALVDQHALGSQTSPRAAGLTSKADTMATMARLRHEACEALERFESEMGRSVDFHRSGSLRAAYTDGGVERVRMAQETAQGLGIEARLIDAAEAERLAPHFKPGAARRILHVPSDGWVGGRPTPRKERVASVMIARARLIVAITSTGPITLGRI